MIESSQKPLRVRMFAVGVATLAISAVFVGMIWHFLTALFLAAIFSAMASPLQRRVVALVGGREGVATAITLSLLILCVLVPTLALIYVSAGQAKALSAGVVSFIQGLDAQGPRFNVPAWLPFKDEIESAGPEIASKIGELTAKFAGFFVSMASAATKGTASFFLNLFILIYAMVFFLREKTSVLTQLMRFSGLSPASQKRLVEQTTSISRATIKGTLVIGAVQGVLGGIGFYAAGIEGAAFWGAVMMIASVIPGIGPALVWVPGVIYLFATGETTVAIGLALWSGLVVSSIDNFLRPILVGRDTEMPDLLILISTLGGLAMFGAVGLIIGPVIAGLFLTMWEITRQTFGSARNGESPDGDISSAGQKQ